MIRRRLLGPAAFPDELTSRQVIKDHERLIISIARRYGPDEDLVQYGRLAALEAFQSFDESAGRSLSSWIFKVVSWRIAEAVKGQETYEQLPKNVLNGKNPEEKFFTNERRMWLECAVALLPPRQATIISAQLAGENLRGIAVQLGISQRRAWTEAKRAQKTLVELHQEQENVVDHDE